jgi:hypothetical protein
MVRPRKPFAPQENKPLDDRHSFTTTTTSGAESSFVFLFVSGENPVNYIDMWGLDMMFSYYIRNSGKMTVYYIPTKADGSVDGNNIHQMIHLLE